MRVLINERKIGRDVAKGIHKVVLILTLLYGRKMLVQDEQGG